MTTIPAIHPQDSTGGTTATTGSGNGLPTSQGLNNMFLQLLVAQLQNQNPLDPMDPTQFVGQLAQFSELSEVTQIAQILQQTVSTTATGKAATPQSIPAKQPSLPAATPSISSAAAAAQDAASNFIPEMPAINRQIQGVF
jgi:flagellar basal-body rod modification protein FlgD